jgi:circadian clock protein KaiB
VSKTVLTSLAEAPLDVVAEERWALTLYVNGASPNSLRAIETVRRLCDEELGGRVDLEVIDIKQEPALVLRDQIIVAPTLVKRLPGPLRRVVGDLSDADRLRLALDLGTVEASTGEAGYGHLGPAE